MIKDNTLLKRLKIVQERINICMLSDIDDGLFGIEKDEFCSGARGRKTGLRGSVKNGRAEPL